jgi:ribulose-5-phosphate 4-epimerase/fuculose-1-phosphate aldolase
MITGNTKTKLAEALQFLAKKQNVIEDTHGNISCLSDNGFVYIKPSGVEYEKITYNEVVCIVPYADGGFLREENGYKESVDTVHHLEIYKRNSLRNIKAICHTHSPYATACAMSLKSIPVCSTEHADYFGHEIRVLQYSDLNSWGQYVRLEADEKAVLLGHHGALTFGDTPMQVAKLAVALEMACKKYAIASSLCVRVNDLPPEEVKKWHERYRTSYGQ